MSLRPYQQAVMDQFCGDRENPNNDRRFTIFVPLGAGSVPVTTKRPGQRAVRTEVQPLGTVAPGSNKAVSTASTAHRPRLLADYPIYGGRTCLICGAPESQACGC